MEPRTSRRAWLCPKKKKRGFQFYVTVEFVKAFLLKLKCAFNT